ncbi:MAG: slipin family protein, partial [bacterium]
MTGGIVVLIIFAVFILASAIRVLKEYERGVIFRLGRMIGAKGPGLILLIPIVDKMVKVSLRTVAMDVPPQDVITKDNVSVQVNAVLYFRVMQAEKAIVEVQDYLYATSQLAQTTLRSVLGQFDLDGILSERDKDNADLKQIIDKHTDPWGIKVSLVEVKHIDLPEAMKRAIARQAEAERERRAKVIHAKGELQAADHLSLASQKLQKETASIQLIFFQTLVVVA